MAFFLILISFIGKSISTNVGCKFTPDNSNVTFDLTPLAEMGTILAQDAANDALTYHLQICANLTGDVCSEIDPGIGCAQEWTDGSCIYWLAAWTSTPSFIVLANETDPTQGLVIGFYNGEICRKSHGQTYLYESRFTFLCDENKNLTVLPAQQPEKCTYEFTIISKYVCVENYTTTTTAVPNSECIWSSSDGHHILNISSIMGQSLSISDADNKDLYYVYTPCSNTLKCDNDTYAMAYLFDDAAFQCKKYLGVWEDGLNEPRYSEELKMWQFVFTNGESCDNLENIFTVQWICDKNATTSSIVKAEELSTCNYMININSSLSCQ